MTSHSDRQNEKLHVARAKGCNHATFADSHATIHATRMQQGSLKALADKVLRRNPVCNSDATKAEKACNFLPEKSLEKLHRVASKNDPAVIEFMELVCGGHVRIHTDGRGALWWSSPRYFDDAGSLSYIAQIWDEAWPGMFRLLAQGKLDGLLRGGDRHAV